MYWIGASGTLLYLLVRNKNLAILSPYLGSQLPLIRCECYASIDWHQIRDGWCTLAIPLYFMRQHPDCMLIEHWKCVWKVVNMLIMCNFAFIYQSKRVFFGAIFYQHKCLTPQQIHVHVSQSAQLPFYSHQREGRAIGMSRIKKNADTFEG